MVMKKYLLLIFVLFSFFTIPLVNAQVYEDYNTTLYLNFGNNLVDLDTPVDLSGHTINDVLSAFTSSSDYYNVIIRLPNSNNSSNKLISIDYYSKSSYSSIPVTFFIRTINNYANLNTYQTNYINHYHYNINFDSNNENFPSNLFSQTNYNRHLNCYKYNTNCYTSGSTSINTTIVGIPNFTPSSDYSIFTNDYEYTVVYYSSSDLILENTIYSPSSSANYYLKNLNINGKNYYPGDVLPTYKDLYVPDYSILLDKDNITNMLVGNITDLYNFRLNLRFFYDNYNYINNMSATYRIYGRKNNTTYYSYDDITSSCSAINGHKLDKNIDTDLKYAQFEYFSQGISCNPNLDLTQYDNFYLDIQTFATSGNYLISYLEYNSTNGNVYFPNSSSYSIYDTFTNLPSDFSLLVTTNYSQRQVNVISDNRYVLGCIVNLYKLSTGGACASPSEIGSLTNLGYMIYKYPEDTSNSVDLSILTSFDSIISYGSNGTGDNSSYTYYDETGTITTGVINNTITLNYNTDNYDVSSYFDIVNNYINDLSTDINNFSNLVQDFYDSAPNFMQVTIYVIFILLCCYIVYLMIRK